MTGLPKKGYPGHMDKYKPRIAITPDVAKELQRLKRQWRLQSHNKVLRRILAERNGANEHAKIS